MFRKSFLSKIATVFCVAVLCILCIATLAACDNKPTQPVVDQYRVTYVFNNGEEDLIAKTIDGKAIEVEAPERYGYEFDCWVDPNTFEPFDFSTVLTSDLVLEASWKRRIYKITWLANDGAEYVFSEQRPNNVPYGTTVSFSLRKSVFYTGTPVVRAGRNVLQERNGKYSFTVDGSCTVSIDRLEPIAADITGNGTRIKPYVLDSFADWKLFTDSVNDPENTTFNSAYVKLGADLDFGGEKIDPVGNALYNDTLFSGQFDGAGHTLKNFSFKSGNIVAAPFGFMYGGTVENLNVEADIEAATDGQALMAGGIVGYSFGGDVIGCTFKGSIEVANEIDPADASVQVGGIIGFAQGDNSNGYHYYATVSYCYADVTIICSGSYDITGAGGIIGAMLGVSYLDSVNVYNCSAKVNIDGTASSVGGICGLQREDTSIDNCYATGILSTVSNEGISYKGGIVGDCFNENCVKYCFSDVKGCTGTSADAHYGIAGIVHPAGYNLGVDDRETVFVKNEYRDTHTYVLSDLVSLLGWATNDWKTLENGAIVPDASAYSANDIDITFVFESACNGQIEAPIHTIIDDESYLKGYKPLSMLFGGDGLNTLTADDGKISYGFFLDAEHTIRISAAFLLTNQAERIYVGFEDYSVLEDTYYAVINNGVDTIEMTLIFGGNGIMTMLSEGTRSTYMYVYDGNRIMISNGYFAYFSYKVNSGYSALTDYYAEITEGGLKIYDTYFYTDGQEVGPIMAVRKNNVMGTWYTTGQSTQYEFLADGTGYFTNGASMGYFTYSVNGNNVLVEDGFSRIVLILADDGNYMYSTDGLSLSVNKYDIYAGLWEGNYYDNYYVYIDGIDTITIGEHSYTYVINGNGDLIADDVTAYYDEDGMLVVVDHTVEHVLGREGSFIGYWEDPALEYAAIFTGINRDGIGLGVDSEGYTFTYTYNPYAEENAFNMFYGMDTYGYGDWGEYESFGDVILELYIYTGFQLMPYVAVSMTYSDKFNGSWSDGSVTYSFNGGGAYTIYQVFGDGVWEVNGKLTISDGENSPEVVDYTYDKYTGEVAFTYDSKNYTGICNGDSITLSAAGQADLVLYAPDEFCDYAWYVTGYKKVIFDGRGKSGNGKVTFIDGSDVEVEYKYVVVGGVATIKDGANVVYTVDSKDMILKDDVGDEVGAMGVYDMVTGNKCCASGMSNGEPYILDFDLSNHLDKNGEMQTMFAATMVKLTFVAENVLAVYDAQPTSSTFGSLLFYLCYYEEDEAVYVAYPNASGGLDLTTELYIPDELMGDYMSDDGTFELFLDGSSNSSYDYGNAVIFEFDENGEYLDDAKMHFYYLADGYYYVVTPRDERVYKISFTEVDGALKLTNEEGSEIWLVKVE